MNIIFFGSSNFAVPSLKALIASGHKISCVVTQPDRQKGRGLHLEGTVAKSVAAEANLKIYQPYRINSDEAIKFLKSFKPDLFIVISYGQILSEDILNIPRIFAINAHASILPKYRGAAPINWAIINGEETSGVTIIKMTHEMDAGPILLQKTIDIKEDDTSIMIEDKLSHLAAQLLLDSLESIENRSYNLILQDENKISFAPKLKKEDGRINWNKSSNDIYNFIRGCLNWPGAFTYYRSKLLKIYRARVATSPRHHVAPAAEFIPAAVEERRTGKSPGEIIEVTKAGIVVATGEGNLIIEELQIEGKRRMKVEEFIIGHKINAGETFNPQTPPHQLGYSVD